MADVVSHRVVVRSKAEADMTAAAKWYEEQSPGLGTEFLRAVEGCIATVARNPAMFPVMYRNVRRALFRRFPYGVFFLLADDCITIIACLHGRQDLNRLKRR
ncbi:MAG: type II toxin-antitoxin system RelE/ParE family toxin [Desulfuromonadales bacterium]